MGLEYLHGTGHGVGAFLSVHEGEPWIPALAEPCSCACLFHAGPHVIGGVARGGTALVTPLQPGMTVTNGQRLCSSEKGGLALDSR